MKTTHAWLGFTPTVEMAERLSKIMSNENSMSMKKQLAIIATLFISSCFVLKESISSSQQYKY